MKMIFNNTFPELFYGWKRVPKLFFRPKKSSEKGLLDISYSLLFLYFHQGVVLCCKYDTHARVAPFKIEIKSNNEMLYISYELKHALGNIK